jgi:hypothetical protein
MSRVFIFETSCEEFNSAALSNNKSIATQALHEELLFSFLA